jgi:phage-related holin
MSKDLNELFREVLHYIHQAFLHVSPFLTLLNTAITYVLFPKDSYIAPAISLGVSVILDILTKYYAISHRNGGFLNAFKIGKINSQSFWEGTRKKLIGYLVIMILAGLSARFGVLQTPAVFFSTIAYSFMFLRECQSIIENLIEAGHKDLAWILHIIKRRQQIILDKETETDGESDKHEKHI